MSKSSSESSHLAVCRWETCTGVDVQLAGERSHVSDTVEAVTQLPRVGGPLPIEDAALFLSVLLSRGPKSESELDSSSCVAKHHEAYA